MIICERPAHPDDHFQDISPSRWSFAFVNCHCLSLFVVVCCLSLFVFCCLFLFVIFRLSLFVVCHLLWFVVCWCLLFVMIVIRVACCLSLVVVCCCSSMTMVIVDTWWYGVLFNKKSFFLTLWRSQPTLGPFVRVPPYENKAFLTNSVIPLPNGKFFDHEKWFLTYLTYI